MSTLASDLVIELENKPGALAKVATAISDAGVNIAAATCMGNGNTAELHILVPHSEPVYRALANTHGPSVTREREVVVVQAKDRPGELAELARMVSDAGINLDIVYVATNSRVVLGSHDTDALKQVLGRLLVLEAERSEAGPYGRGPERPGRANRAGNRPERPVSAATSGI